MSGLEFDIADIPEFVHRAPSLYVPFEARKLRAPRLVWLDRRWFLERGIDAMDDREYDRLRAWLLDEFAYSVPQAHDADAAFTQDTRTFAADRYGGIGVGAHGGSGRCGTAGKFQVKGIGVTPLVGVGADEQHSHGSVILEEAIRESVYAELADLELPFGAIAMVAIIETGTRTRLGEAKALLVRPNFLRASSLERSAFYWPRVSAHLDHLPDVARVKEMIATVGGGTERRAEYGVHLGSFGEFVERAIRQLSYTQAYRLYFGSYTTSNLTLNAELFDYGAARSVPNWEPAVDTYPAFGLDDIKVFRDGCQAQAFYHRKYGLASDFLDAAADYDRQIDEEYASSLDEELLRLFGLSRERCATATAAAVVGELRKYFTRQQRMKDSYLADPERAPPTWIYEEFLSPSASAKTSYEARVGNAIKAALHVEFAGEPDPAASVARCLAEARRTLKPRPLMVREVLQTKINADIMPKHEQGLSESGLRDCVEQLIEATVAASRRCFRGVPDGLAIRGGATRAHSTAVYCEGPAAGQKSIVLQAYERAGSVRLFDTMLPVAGGKGSSDRVSRWSAQVPVDADYHGDSITIEVQGVPVTIPAMDALY